MKSSLFNKKHNKPLLYYRTKEDIQTYRKRPVSLKLKWLEAQMEFFYKAMSPKAKKIREDMEV